MVWGSREGCSLLSLVTIISLSDPDGRCGAYSVLAYIRSGDWPALHIEHQTPARVSTLFFEDENIQRLNGFMEKILGQVFSLKLQGILVLN